MKLNGELGDDACSRAGERQEGGGALDCGGGMQACGGSAHAVTVGAGLHGWRHGGTP